MADKQPPPAKVETTIHRGKPAIKISGPTSPPIPLPTAPPPKPVQAPIVSR